MLILFDIDGTLITTGGVGIRAMVAAGRELFGPRFHADGIVFAGRLDPLILGDMFRQSGVEDSPENFRAIRRSYARHLGVELAAAQAKRALPGVLDLVGLLRQEREVTLGLLTGNFAETGSMKLRACGIEPDHFPIQAWGDESPNNPPSRNDLPPVALARDRVRRGHDLPGHAVTIIGDTPHDVACAKAHGCRSLAVATGRSTPAELSAAGADHVALDLSDTPAILSWLKR